MYIYIYIIIDVCIYVHVYEYKHICLHGHICVYTHICVYVYIYIYIYIYIDVCLYICLYVCLCSRRARRPQWHGPQQQPHTLNPRPYKMRVPWKQRVPHVQYNQASSLKHVHTVEYDPFIQSQLAPCNWIEGPIWCKDGHVKLEILSNGILVLHRVERQYLHGHAVYKICCGVCWWCCWCTDCTPSCSPTTLSVPVQSQCTRSRTHIPFMGWICDTMNVKAVYGTYDEGKGCVWYIIYMHIIQAVSNTSWTIIQAVYNSCFGSQMPQVVLLMDKLHVLSLFKPSVSHPPFPCKAGVPGEERTFHLCDLHVIWCM